MVASSGEMAPERFSGAAAVPTGFVLPSPDVQRERIAEAMKLEMKQGQVS